MSHKSISNWENGKPIPAMLAYLMSAYALGIPGYGDLVVKDKVKV